MHSFLLTSFKQKYSDDFSAWPSESHAAEICRTTQPQLSAVLFLPIQSAICASGSVEQVLACKHYNRALRVHKLVLEALERQLLIKFLATSDASMKKFKKCRTQQLLCSVLARKNCKLLWTVVHANSSMNSILSSRSK